MPFSSIDEIFANHYVRKMQLTDQKSALFLSALFYVARKGHFCLDLVDPIKELLDLKQDLLKGAETVYARVQQQNLDVLHLHNGAYYLKRQFGLEKRIATALKNIRAKQSEPFFSLPTKAIQPATTQTILSFCRHHSPVFITGGPGSGKTYLAKQIIKLFLQSTRHKLVTIAAYTAKAAHLFSPLKTPQIEITTLHTLIKPNAPDPPKIHTDLLIIDECSMIGPAFFYKILQAILPNTLVIFMGDPYQLAPVESLSIFQHAAPLLKRHHFHLEKSYRSNKSIQELSNLVLQRDRQGFLTKLQEDPHLELIDPQKIDLLDYLKKALGECYPKGTCQGPVQKLLILTPFAQASKGYIRLNQKLEQSLNFAFTPIIIEKNDPTINLSNGQTGVLVDQYAHFFFETYSRKIHRSLLPTFSPSYATSIHKSQGSSATHCIILLDRMHDLVTPNLLYTAITRAKQKITFISTKEVLLEAICMPQTLSHNLASHL